MKIFSAIMASVMGNEQEQKEAQEYLDNLDKVK